MENKKELNEEEKRELIGTIIQSIQWAIDAAVEDDDDTLNATCNQIGRAHV